MLEGEREALQSDRQAARSRARARRRTNHPRLRPHRRRRKNPRQSEKKRFEIALALLKESASQKANPKKPNQREALD